MKSIEVSDEDYARLQAFATRANVTVSELLSGLASLMDAKTTSDALEALYEAHTTGTSWYLLRKAG